MESGKKNQAQEEVLALLEELRRAEYRERVLERIVEKNADIEQELREIVAERDELARVLDEVYKSNSWRITRPIRRASSLVRKLISKILKSGIFNQSKKHRLGEGR